MTTLISPNIINVGVLKKQLENYSDDVSIAYCDFGMPPMMIYDDTSNRIIIAGNSYFTANHTDIKIFIDFANKKDYKGRIISPNDAFWLSMNGYKPKEIDTTIPPNATINKDIIILPSGNIAKILREE